MLTTVQKRPNCPSVKSQRDNAPDMISYFDVSPQNVSKPVLFKKSDELQKFFNMESL